MKKKILIGVIGVVAVCAGLYFGYMILKSENDQNVVSESISAIETTQKPQETSADDSQVQWNDYEVYQNELFDFDFIIADITIKSEEEINLSLDCFVTSEGISLSQYSDYVDVLENNSYYLGKKNVWFSIVSATGEFNGNIFIPILDKEAQSISVTYDLSETGTETFDLSKNQASIEDLLYYDTQETISDGNTYEMQVSDAFELSSEEMREDGQAMILPSSARIFALKVKAVSLWGDEVVINKAVFTTDDGLELVAEESSISSMKYQNIISTKINEKDEGCLFFIILDPDRSLEDYEGILQLTLNDSDTPIEINVSIGG